MKYKAGDKVRIKSLDWYYSNKNRLGEVWTKSLDGEYKICFDRDMIRYCGMETVIFSVERENYVLKGIPYAWTDEMIEGLAEDETKPKYEDEVNGEYYSTTKYLVRPNGYQFVDENGNVINAMKIVLEKKKNDYPKTYERCCEILDIKDNKPPWHGYRSVQMRLFQKVLICRDAYWRLSGDWKPDWLDDDVKKYVISRNGNYDTFGGLNYSNRILAFPTAEMRDAFYDNFKELISECKELL